jgi:hypothetical protein
MVVAHCIEGGCDIGCCRIDTDVVVAVAVTGRSSVTDFVGVKSRRSGGKVCILRWGKPFHWACRDRNQARDSFLVLVGLLLSIKEELEVEDSATAERDRAGPFDSDMFLQILKPTICASTEGTSWSFITGVRTIQNFLRKNVSKWVNIRV